MNEYLKKIQSDIDQMNKTFDDPGNEPDPTAAPSTDAPDDLKTEAPSTDAPEDLKTDPPSTDEPKTDPPSTEAPDDRDQTIEELRRKLAEKDKPPKTLAPTTKAPLTFDDQDFIGDLDFDDVKDDPKKFNKLLNKIYQKAVTDVQGSLGQSVNQSVPEMVKSITNMQTLSESFYKDNKDLVKFKKVVANVFDDLYAKDTTKTYGEVMADVAPEVRKRLELPEPSKKVLDKGTPPKLPRKKGKSGKADNKPNLTNIESQIDDMNKVLMG